MEKYWKDKDGETWHGGSIVTADGRRVFNPTEDQLLANGYTQHEWPVYEPTIEDVRQRKIAEIDAYDKSEAVNSFMLDGMAVWLDKDTRVGLMNSLNCEKQAGRTETTLWLGTQPISLNIERAMQLLAMVELYALECFGVTAQHKANVEALTDIEAIEAYDFTVGYPEKPDIRTYEQQDSHT